MLADWVFKHESPTWMLWIGSLCVILGFVAVTMQPTLPSGTADNAAMADGCDTVALSPVVSSSGDCEKLVADEGLPGVVTAPLSPGMASPGVRL